MSQSPFTQKVHIPELAGIANALGAALAQVSGTVDVVVSLQNREETLKKLENLANRYEVFVGT